MKSCTQCQTLLVDYADRRLNDIDRQRVDAHLAECPACRGQLADERWLTVRLHNVANAWPVEQLFVWPDRPASARPRKLRRGVFVATALAALAVVVLVWRLPFPTNETIAARSSTVRASVSDDRQFADLQAAIEREACAAKLAMSAELLAAEPAAGHDAAEALRFVAEAFPDTTAGRDAARRADARLSPVTESL